MENVLITGGLGFIGGNLNKVLLDKGVNTTIVDFAKNRKAPSKSKLINIDVRDLKTSDIEGFDTIFHFGSPCSTISYEEEPEGSMSNTINGFMHILELARQTKATVIYPSSGNIYASPNPYQKETDLPNPQNLYAIGKITEEYIADYYRKKFNMKIMGVRIFAGYGYGERKKGKLASAITQFIENIKKDESPVIWGDGNQRRDFVFIEDIINLLISCAEDIKAPILNIGSGEGHTFNEIIIMINDILDKDIKPKYIGRPSNYIQNATADLTLAKQLYNFKPTPLKEGLTKYLMRWDEEW